MSGLEIIILVGGAVYIANKVHEKREKKRLAAVAGHGPVQLVEPTTRTIRNQRVRQQQQVPVEEQEPLPLYRAPTGPPPIDITDSEGKSIHLPTYDEASERLRDKELEAGEDEHQGENTLSRMSSSQASSSVETPLATPLTPTSPQTGLLVPTVSTGLPSDTPEKKRRFWRRSTSAKTSVA